MDKLNPKKRKIFSDRLAIVVVTITAMFGVLIYQFYKLQILEHDNYEANVIASVQQEVELPAIRGLIYDRYGKPLVSNKPVYVLKTDPEVSGGIKADIYNEVLLSVARLLEANGDTYIDNMPITRETPFEFTEDAQSVRTFITNYVPYNNQEHKETLYKMTATELIDYLKGEDAYNLAEELSDEEARIILAMKLEISQTRYQKYKKVTLATDISMETVAAIEENQEEYISILPEVESERYYTEEYSKAFGNILGYTRKITQSQYESLKEEGYDKSDIVGQVGVEGMMEKELRGEKGSQLIEVDNVGRTVFTLETNKAKPGNDVYLTMDANLQLATYNAMEKRLAEGIISRLQGKEKTIPLTGREVLISMAKNNQLDFNQMKEAPSSTMQKQLYDKINVSYEKRLEELEKLESSLPEEEKTNLSIKQHFSDMLDDENNIVTNQELLLALGEAGTLKLTENEMKSIRSGNIGSIESILIRLLESGELKPDQTAIMPFSGSAVVVDVNTGEILSMVGYPSYDSNEFTQDFNTIYRKLHDGVDERNIEINRALKTAKAPGSTFKMIVAAAGLEEGVITPDTLISCSGVYPNAGDPGPKCWIYTNTGHGHGSLNVKGALEVSCNYYFYDVAYRLGLKYGGAYGGIDALSKYVEMFGLSEKSGIGLDEAAPNISNPQNMVSTQAARSLNTFKNMMDVNSKTRAEVLEEIQAKFDNFYMGANNESQDIDILIDYLSADDIKNSIDSQIGIVLAEDMEVIYDKIIEDISVALETGVPDISDQIAKEVLSRPAELSLKGRTKDVVRETLVSYTEPGTRKTIEKSLAKIPEGLLKQAYLDSYNTLYDRYKDDPASKNLASELMARIELIEKGNFNEVERTTTKIIERIFDVYVDYFFEDVDIKWNVADNVRTAIGQGGNTFTPVQMARYMAGLANGHTVYDLKVVGGIDNNKTTGEYESIPTNEFGKLDFKESTLMSIYEGMNRVASGSAGTARTYFSDFPIPVALKTGTAQEGLKTIIENSWFVGFAPYDKPEVAVVTSIYGADGIGGVNTQLAKDIFEAYYELKEEKEELILGNKFVP